MQARPVAQRAAFISAVIGPVIGALFLFAPIHGYCSTSIVTPAPPGATPGPSAAAGPQTCASEALWQRQQLFPMPFFAVLVWSLAPVLVFLGILLRLRGRRGVGTGLVVAGLLLESTVLISFGAAPLFAPLVLLPLAITTTFALRRS
jgi:hypothetical protein